MFESVRTPGPGNYIVATIIGKKCKENKFTPHKPLHPRENAKADMNSYDPCSAQYNTFTKYSMTTKMSAN